MQRSGVGFSSGLSAQFQPGLIEQLAAFDDMGIDAIHAVANADAI